MEWKLEPYIIVKILIMKNRSVFFIILGAWCFGFILSAQNYFRNSSTFLLSHGVTVLELTLGVLTLYFLIPIILFSAYLLLKRVSGIAELYLTLILALLIAQGIAKNIDIILDLSTGAFYLSLIVIFIMIIYLLLKFLPKTSNMQLIFVFFPLTLFLLFFQTDLPKYISKDLRFDNIKIEPNGTPITFILLDELSLANILKEPGKINKERFPGFNELSKVTTFYPFTTANSGYTDFSVPSILTGKYPEYVDQIKTPRVNSNFPNNLLKLLTSTYNVSAAEIVTDFCEEPKCVNPIISNENSFYRNFIFDDLRIVLNASLLPNSEARKRYPKLGISWGNFRNSKIEDENKIESVSRLAEFDKLLNKDYESKLKTLDFIHVLFPHPPYEYLPSGKRIQYSRALELNAEAQDLTMHGLEIHQANLFQLKYLDQYMYRLAKKIESDLNDHIVVITSDHGVSFQKNKSFRGGLKEFANDSKTMASVMYVPLFIHWPKSEGGETILKNVQLIDIFPTIIQELGIEDHSLEKEIDGISLNSKDEHENPWWYTGNMTLSYSELNSGLSELIAENNKLFGTYLPNCDIFGFGPFKDIVCKNISDFNIDKSNMKSVLANEKTFSNLNQGIYSLSPIYLIYGDELSKKLQQNVDLKKWFAVTYDNKILSVVNGIAQPSLRDKGKALDLAIYPILDNSELEIDIKKVQIYEITSSNILARIQ